LSKLLPIALLIFLSSSPAAIAQFAGNGSWLERWFSPARPQGQDLQPQYQPPLPKRKGARPKPAQNATPDKPPVTPTYFVAVLGDNLGQLMGQGLTDAFAGRPEISIMLKGRDNSGLVRDDFYDWPKAVHDLLASGEKINMAVMLIGSNDHQPMRIGNVTYEPGSPQWIEIYTARIAEISKAFREKNIPLIWVGLPIVKSDRLSADFLTFNDYFREQAEKAGAAYTDIWEAFEDDHGQYDPFGPDVNGQTVRIRTVDGVNFTKAGARKLAHFVEADIRRGLDATEPQVDPAVVTVPADNTAAPAAPAVPIKPIAGPVLPLTGPVSSPGGQLATRVKVEAGGASPAFTEPALTEGKPPEPKPHRADDFTWPRP